MMLWVTCLIFLACTLMALRQKKHWQTVTSTPHHSQISQRLNITAWILCSLSFALCVAAEGLSFAVLLWPLLFALASLSTALMIAFKPDWLLPIAHWFQQ